MKTRFVLTRIDPARLTATERHLQKMALETPRISPTLPRTAAPSDLISDDIQPAPATGRTAGSLRAAAFLFDQTHCDFREHLFVSSVPYPGAGQRGECPGVVVERKASRGHFRWVGFSPHDPARRACVHPAARDRASFGSGVQIGSGLQIAVGAIGMRMFSRPVGDNRWAPGAPEQRRGFPARGSATADRAGGGAEGAENSIQSGRADQLLVDELARKKADVTRKPIRDFEDV